MKLYLVILVILFSFHKSYAQTNGLNIRVYNFDDQSGGFRLNEESELDDGKNGILFWNEFFDDFYITAEVDYNKLKGKIKPNEVLTIRFTALKNNVLYKEIKKTFTFYGDFSMSPENKHYFLFPLKTVFEQKLKIKIDLIKSNTILCTAATNIIMTGGE